MKVNDWDGKSLEAIPYNFQTKGFDFFSRKFFSYINRTINFEHIFKVVVAKNVKLKFLLP